MYTNFENALRELLKGRKIRNCNWDKHEYIKLENGELRDYNNCPCELNLSEEGSIRYLLAYQWEVLPTTEELLTVKGKAYDIASHCFNIEESCAECTLEEKGCNQYNDYFFELITEHDPQTDKWFRENMDTINEMWSTLNNGEEWIQPLERKRQTIHKR